MRAADLQRAVRLAAGSSRGSRLNVIGHRGGATPVRSGRCRSSLEVSSSGARRWDPAGHRRRPTPSDASTTRSSAWPTARTTAYLRREGRIGVALPGPTGARSAYGYALRGWPVGPFAARDPDLLAPVIGHLTSAIALRGAFAMWLPGSASAPCERSEAGLPRPVPDPVCCWDGPRRLRALRCRSRRDSSDRTPRLRGRVWERSMVASGRLWLPLVPADGVARPCRRPPGVRPRPADRSDDRHPAPASRSLASSPLPVVRPGPPGARPSSSCTTSPSVPERQGRAARRGPGRSRRATSSSSWGRPERASPRS
jgi:hypothetical protein